MASILRRPLDLIIVISLLFFFLIAITIDFSQSLYGPVHSVKDVKERVWPPKRILESYAWWCATYDPLLANNPIWYETMSWFSPFLYAPFYIFAIYAFILGREWIRIPALMWSYGLLLMMAVVVREQLFGEFAAPDVLMFALAYGSYIVIPALVLLRVARAPVFSTAEKAHSD